MKPCSGVYSDPGRGSAPRGPVIASPSGGNQIRDIPSYPDCGVYPKGVK